MATFGAMEKDDESRIRNVWAHNLKEELKIIGDVVDLFPIISMDTEFPGVVARPVGSFKNAHEYHYRTLKCNVDILKIIQLGLSFQDEDGNLKDGICTWQFNFKFNLNNDMYAQDSINLLRNAGLDFDEFHERGISIQHFGEVLMTSGLVLNDDLTWVSFHGGYDFAYLTKILHCLPLPDEESKFFELVRLYFPSLYDVKHLAGYRNLRGGLSDLAAELDVNRVGMQHQAGSDSHLTGRVFYKMRELLYDNKFDASIHCNILYGLGSQRYKP